MPRIWAALFLLVCVNATATQFDISRDGLCFGNFTDSFKYGNPPLRQWANRTGSCQGMVGLTRALLKYARFQCNGERPNKAQSHTMLRTMRRLQSAGCGRQGHQISIEGYCSIREFCTENIDLFQAESIDANAQIAVQYILRDLRKLFEGPTPEAQKRNMQMLHRIFHEVTHGRPPLMHYPWHAVMVVDARMEWNADRNAPDAILTLYDPNSPDALTTRKLAIASNLEATENEDPIFVLIPEPSTELKYCRTSSIVR